MIRSGLLVTSSLTLALTACGPAPVGEAQSPLTSSAAPTSPTPNFIDCTVDTDCVAVAKPSCCPDGERVAIATVHQAEYLAANACVNPPQVCPHHVIADDRVAECAHQRSGKGQCQLVAPADIRCGGLIAWAHSCPTGWHCQQPLVRDLPGICVKDPQPCGGLAALGCPAGQSCVDDPNDDCDPLLGDADCTGVCAASN
jgi:hypothetical protein